MDGQISVTDFAKAIREKENDYFDVDDTALAKAYIEKYPDYANTVNFSSAPQVPKTPKAPNTISNQLMTAREVDDLLNGEHGQKFRQFFNAVKRAEGGQPDLVTGGKIRFNPANDHPNVVGMKTAEGTSTAAGDYQILGSNWYGLKNGQKVRAGLKDRLGAKDFSPENQLRGAVMLFGDRGRAGIEAIKRGDWETAMSQAALDWAAVPGSTLHKKIAPKKKADFYKYLGENPTIQPQSYLPPADAPQVNITGGEVVPMQFATPENVSKLGLPFNAPVPEHPNTLLAQVNSAIDDNSPKIAVLLSQGESIVSIPYRQRRNFIPIQTANGLLLVNPNKAKSVGLNSNQDIKNYVAQNGVADLIGKVEDVGNKTNEGVAVRTQDANGNELSTSVVTNPNSAKGQIKVDQEQFPNSMSEIMPVSAAVLKRIMPTRPTPPNNPVNAPVKIANTPAKTLQFQNGQNLTLADDQENLDAPYRRYLDQNNKSVLVKDGGNGQFQVIDEESYRKNKTIQSLPKFDGKNVNWLNDQTIATKETKALFNPENEKIYQKFLTQLGAEDTEGKRQRFLQTATTPFSDAEKQAINQAYGESISVQKPKQVGSKTVQKSGQVTIQTKQKGQTSPQTQPEQTDTAQELPSLSPDSYYDTVKFDKKPQGRNVSARDWQIEQLGAYLSGDAGIKPSDTREYFKQRGFYDLQTGKEMSDETLENRIGTGKEFYRLTRGDVEEIRQFSKLRREQLFNGLKDRLATGEPFSADEVADLQKKYDITPEELLAFTTAPENEELRQKGEQNRNVYQSALTEKAEDDSFTPNEKEMYARYKAGWVDEKSYNKFTQEQQQAKEEIANDLQSGGALKYSTGTMLARTLTPFGVIKGIYEDWNDTGKNSAEMKNKIVSDRLAEIENTFGSYQKFKEVQAVADKMPTSEWIARGVVDVGRSAVNTAVSLTIQGLDVLDALNEKYDIYQRFVPEQYRINVRNLGNLIGYTTAVITGKGDDFIRASDTTDVNKRLFYTLGKNLKEYLGDDKYLQISNNPLSLGKLTQGLGSSLGFMVMGLLAPEMSVSTRLGEFGIAAAVTGGVGGAGEFYEQGKQKGLTESEALNAGAVGFLINTSEGFGVGGSLARGLKEFEKSSLTKLFTTFVTEAGEEFGQETFQNTAHDSFWKFVAEKDKPLAERIYSLTKDLPNNVAKNAIENGLVAFLTGGVFGGSMHVIGSKVNEEAPITQLPLNTSNGQVFVSTNQQGIGQDEIRAVDKQGNEIILKQQDLTGKTQSVAYLKEVVKNIAPQINEEKPKPIVNLKEPKTVKVKNEKNLSQPTASVDKSEVLQNDENVAPEKVGATKPVKEKPIESKEVADSALTEPLTDKPTRQKLKAGEGFEIKQREVKTEEEKPTKHDFSSTQVNLPKAESNKVLQVGNELIKDADLADSIDWNPREENPHITVKYGLHTNQADEVRKILADVPPFEVTLGKTSIFPAKEGADYDVVKVDVDSPELHRINKLIADNTDVTDTHPTYNPHVTLAYVKKGEGKKYVGNDAFAGQKLTFNEIQFSDKNGNQIPIKLGGKDRSTAVFRQRENVFTPAEKDYKSVPKKVGVYGQAKEDVKSSKTKPFFPEMRVFRQNEKGEVEFVTLPSDVAQEVMRQDDQKHADKERPKVLVALKNWVEKTQEPISAFIDVQGITNPILVKDLEKIALSKPYIEREEKHWRRMYEVYKADTENPTYMSRTDALPESAKQGLKKAEKWLKKIAEAKGNVLDNNNAIEAEVVQSQPTTKETKTIAPKTETRLQEIGKGSSGNIVASKDLVYKKLSQTEADIHEQLNNIEGIAQAKVEKNQLVRTKYDRIISTDDIPKADRSKILPIIRKNVKRMLSAVNALSNANYNYNDILQFGYKQGQLDLLDFGNANKETEPYHNNLGLLANFFQDFGMASEANLIRDGLNIKNEVELASNFADTNSKIGETVAQVQKGLGKNAPQNIYYTSNARLIPSTDVRIGQTDKTNNVKYVFSEKPLSKKFQKEWELSPLIETQSQSIDDSQTKDSQETSPKTSGTDSERLNSIAPENDSILKSTADTFFSQVERTIENSPQSKFSKEQAKALFKNAKQEEVDWLGLNDWIDEQNGTITKDDLLNFVKANNVQVEEVVLGKNGADRDKMISDRVDEIISEDANNRNAWEEGYDPENYMPFDETTAEERENAIRQTSDFMEAVERKAKEDIDYELQGVKEQPTKFSDWQTEGERTNYREIFVTAPNVDGDWKDGHEAYNDVKNPIGRIRMSDRVDIDGKKTLFIDEFQTVGTDNFAKMPKILQKYAYPILVKKALRIASEGNYDQIAFTTGEQQADRYNLAKEVKSIDYSRVAPNLFDVIINLQNNQGKLLMEVDSKTEKVVKIHSDNAKDFEGKSFTEVVGKTLSDKILQSDTDGIIQGDGLKLGGKGLTNLYNQTIVNHFNKIGKKFRAKVGSTIIDSGLLKKGGDEARELANNKVLWEEQVDPNNEMPFDDYSYEERLKVAQEVVQEYNGKVQITVHSITITPEMRDSVMQGQPLFQKSTKEARQAIQDIQGADTKWLFDNYDTGHITLEPITVKTTIGNKTTEYQHSIVSLNNPIGVEIIRQLETGFNNKGREFGSKFYKESDFSNVEAFYVPPSIIKGIADELKVIKGLNLDEKEKGREIYKMLKEASNNWQSGVIFQVFDNEALVHELAHKQLESGSAGKILAVRYGDLTEFKTPTDDGINQSFNTFAKNFFHRESRSYTDANGKVQKVGSEDYFKNFTLENMSPKELGTIAEEAITYFANNGHLEDFGLDNETADNLILDLFERYEKANKTAENPNPLATFDAVGSAYLLDTAYNYYEYKKSQEAETTSEASSSSERVGEQTLENTEPSNTLENSPTSSQGNSDTKPGTDRRYARRILKGKSTVEISESEQEKISRAFEETVAKETNQPIAQVQLKNRQYADTLRENGRNAYQSDVEYLPESEREWSENAKKIIEDSLDKGDFSEAIKEFENSKQPASFRAVLGVALIDHLGASGNFDQMRKVADATVEIVGKAGQVLRASQMVSKYDFAKGVQIATKGLQKIGEEISDNQIEEIKQKTARYSDASENEMVTSAEMEKLKESQKQLSKERNELAHAYGLLKNQKDRLSLKFSDLQKLYKKIKKELEQREANKPPKQKVIPYSKLAKELTAKREELLKHIQEKFGDGRLNSTKNQDAIAINRREWWHVPPQDNTAYQKRGKFYSSSFEEAEFYGIKGNAQPEKVNVQNVLVGDENFVQKTLFGQVQNVDQEMSIAERFALDAKMAQKAKSLGYDSIAVLSPKGFENYQNTGKLPKSIELNTLEQVQSENLSTNDNIEVYQNDAVQKLQDFVDEGRKFDAVFLDPPYFSRALIGGNRGVNEYKFISATDFGKVAQSINQLVDENNHVYLMLSGAKTAQADMQKYLQQMENAGFVLTQQGKYQKTFQDGKPVTNVRGEVAEPEQLYLFTKSGKSDSVNLDFTSIRPTGYQTQKANDFVAGIIRQSTQTGQTILDPFAGSGVVGVEAEKLGRQAVLIEKSEKTLEDYLLPNISTIQKGLFDNEILRSTAPTTIDQEVIDFATLRLIEALQDGINPTEFTNQLFTDFYGAFNPIQLQEIHATAINNLRRGNAPMDSAQQELNRNRRNHYAVAEKFANREQIQAENIRKKILGDYFAELRKSAKEEEKRIAQENKKANPIDALAKEKEQKLKREQSAIDFILSVGIDKGYSDEVLQTALALKSADFTDGLKRVREMFPQMTASELGKVSLEAKKLIEESAKIAKQESIKRRYGIDATDELLKQKDNELKDAQFKRHQAKKALDAYYSLLQKSKSEKVFEGITFIPDLMRTLMSTGEISQIGRQGFPTLLTFTTEWAKSLKGIKAGLSNPQTAFQYAQSIANSPRFSESQKYGVEYSAIGDYVLGDEHFPVSRMFNRLAEKDYKLSKIPVLGTLLSGAAKTQQRMEHAYNLPADSQRFFLYDTMASIIDSQGLSDKQIEVAKKRIAYYANILTGKGSLAKLIGHNSFGSRLLSTLGFAPNLLASRFETAFHFNPLISPILAPTGLKGTIFKKSLRLYTIPAILALALSMIFEPEDEDKQLLDVINPLSKDFLRVRIKNTDINLDVSSGMSEMQRLMFYDLASLGYTLFTGNEGEFQQKAELLAGKEINTYLSSRFVRGKLAPASSLAVDLVSGSDYLGRPINWSEGGYFGAITSRFIPLTYQNVWDSLTYDENYSMLKEPQTFENAKAKASRFSLANIPTALLYGTMQAVGLQANQYEKGVNSLAEDVAWGMWQNKYEAKNPQLTRVRGELRVLFRKKMELERKNQDTSGVDKVIEEIKTKYQSLGEKVVSDAKEQAKQGKFSFVTQEFTPEQIRKIMIFATESEKTELQKILQKKAKSAESKGENQELKVATNEQIQNLIEQRKEFGKAIPNAKDNPKAAKFLNDLRQLEDAKVITKDTAIQIRTGGSPIAVKIAGYKEPKDAVEVFNNNIGNAKGEEKDNLILVLKRKFHSATSASSKQIYFDALKPYLDDGTKESFQVQINIKQTKKQKMEDAQDSLLNK